MPIYRYRCQACDAVFKALVKNGSDPAITCPECNSQCVKRLLPRVGVIYKGKGYHRTDYRDRVGASSDTDQSGNKNEE